MLPWSCPPCVARHGHAACCPVSGGTPRALSGTFITGTITALMPTETHTASQAAASTQQTGEAKPSVTDKVAAVKSAQRQLEEVCRLYLMRSWVGLVSAPPAGNPHLSPAAPAGAVQVMAAPASLVQHPSAHVPEWVYADAGAVPQHAQLPVD